MWVDELKGKKVIVFGAGKNGISTVRVLLHHDIKVLACFDNDMDKQGESLWGVVPVVRVSLIEEECVVVMPFSNEHIILDIETQCKKIGFHSFYILSPRDLRASIKLLPDRQYLEILAKERTGYFFDLDNPRSFNEKIQWLKLYDHNPLYHTLADKFEVKEYVESLIGKQHIIPTLGVWDSFEDVDIENLPNNFVIKCTHDSGSVEIIEDSTHIDYDLLKAKFMKAQQVNYYSLSREWCYKGLSPRIIAEKYMGKDLNDYKFMCFGGEVKCCFTCSERFSEEGLKVTFFDRQWNRLPFRRHYPSSNTSIPKPRRFEEMIQISETLSKGIPFVRIDLYEIGSEIYFGEYTFYPGAGFEEFEPIEWDYKLGEWLQLPR